MTDLICKGCKRPAHPFYKYSGYCLDCFNARVPEKDAEIAALKDAWADDLKSLLDERAKLRALMKVDAERIKELESEREEERDRGLNNMLNAEERIRELEAKLYSQIGQHATED